MRRMLMLAIWGLGAIATVVANAEEAASPSDFEVALQEEQPANPPLPPVVVEPTQPD